MGTSATDPVTFTNITKGTVPLTYTWAFGDGVTSTLEEPTHKYAQAGDYTVHLTATNAYGTDVTTATLMVRDIFTWTGAVGTDWHVAANWSAAAIPGAADNVVIPSNPSGGRWPVITGSAASWQLSLYPEATLLVDAGAALNIEGALINQGRLIQRASVDGSEPVDFLRVDTLAGDPRYRGVIIDAGGDMGTVTVTVRSGQGCGAAGTLPETVQRCYDITPQITQTATITFYYHTDEANGNQAPGAYHYIGGGQWEALTMIPSEVDVFPWHLVVAVADAYSPFALKDNEPAVVGVYGMRGSGSGSGRVLLVAGCVLGLALVLHVRRKRRG
jgi:PKD repeat protein